LTELCIVTLKGLTNLDGNKKPERKSIHLKTKVLIYKLTIQCFSSSFQNPNVCNYACNNTPIDNSGCKNYNYVDFLFLLCTVMLFLWL